MLDVVCPKTIRRCSSLRRVVWYIDIQMSVSRVVLFRILASMLIATMVAIGTATSETRSALAADKGASPAIPIGDADGDGDVDLDDLAKRIGDSKGVGLLTKLSLKREIDGLERDLKSFHDSANGTLDKLHERYDLLVHKVMSLLQDKDPKLARDVSGARDLLWSKLADPNEFRRL
jgi:hypothetical protein